ncbi:hypothetical protein TWF173_004411 [Orbilia oligospora]|nr:hypothetical protein TWF173_004411 [Orbilia oligospora]
MDKPTENNHLNAREEQDSPSEHPTEGPSQDAPQETPQDEYQVSYQVQGTSQGTPQSTLLGTPQNSPQSSHQDLQSAPQGTPQSEHQISHRVQGIPQHTLHPPPLGISQNPPPLSHQGLHGTPQGPNLSHTAQIKGVVASNPQPPVRQRRSPIKILPNILEERERLRSKPFSPSEREKEYHYLMKEVSKVDPRVHRDLIGSLVAFGEAANQECRRLTQSSHGHNDQAAPPGSAPTVNPMGTQALRFPQSTRQYRRVLAGYGPDPARLGPGPQQAQQFPRGYGQNQPAPNPQQAQTYSQNPNHPDQVAPNPHENYGCPQAYARSQPIPNFPQANPDPRTYAPVPPRVSRSPQDNTSAEQPQQYYADFQMRGTPTGNSNMLPAQGNGNPAPRDISPSAIHNPQTSTPFHSFGFHPDHPVHHDRPVAQSLHQAAAATPLQSSYVTTLSSQQVASNSSSHLTSTTNLSRLSSPSALERANPVTSPRLSEETAPSDQISPLLELRLAGEAVSTRAPSALAPVELSESTPVKASKAEGMSRRASQKRPRPSPESSPEPSKRTELIAPSETMDSDIGPLLGDEPSSATADNEGDGAMTGPLSDINVDESPLGNNKGVAASKSKEGPTTTNPAPGKENQKAGLGREPWRHMDLVNLGYRDRPFISPFVQESGNPVSGPASAPDSAVAVPTTADSAVAASAVTAPGAQTRSTRATARPMPRARVPPSSAVPTSLRRSRRNAKQEEDDDEMETAEIARKTKAEAFAKLSIMKIESNADAMRALLFQMVHGIFFQTRSGTGEPQTAQARERLVLLISQGIRALIGTGDGILDVVCDVWRRDFGEELRRPNIHIGPPVRRNRETEGLDFCDPGTRVRCSICGRRHGVRFSVGFSGTPYKSNRGHRPEDMMKSSDSDLPGPPRTPSMRFNVGRRCTELITNYHALRQWERALKAWVRERMQEFGHIIEGGYLNRNHAGGASFEFIGDIVQRLLEERAEDGTPKVYGFLEKLTRAHARSLEIRQDRKGKTLRFRKRYGPGTGKKKGADKASAPIERQNTQEIGRGAPGNKIGPPRTLASLLKRQPSLSETGQNAHQTTQASLPSRPTDRPGIRVRYHGIGRIRTRAAIDSDSSDEILLDENHNGDESSDSDDYVFLDDEDETKEYRERKDQWDENRRGGH